jgi:hypothetical protein
MKRIAQLVLLTVLLAACATPAVDIPSASPGPSATQTLTPKNTSTALRPTLTPALDLNHDRSKPETPTITPLPTIPTFTPTFDVRTIVTVTPAPKAECPTIQENAVVTLSNFDDYYPEMLTALNQGAPINKIVDVFGKEFGEHLSMDPIRIEYKTVDVTGDGTPEILLPGSSMRQLSAVIFGCVAGQYERLYTHPYVLNYLSLEINDANRNGIPEVFIGDDVCSASGCSFMMSVIEWHQNAFKLIQDDIGGLGVASSWITIADIDNDDLKEIFWHVDTRPRSLVISPWRSESHLYKWNGTKFVELPDVFGSPQYRFQAVQDADWEVINGEYEKALSLYQDVIFDNKLGWWSSERQFYNWITQPDNDDPVTPVPTLPPKDKAEYPRLAAYAYYRMIILHTFLGETEAAQVKYATLQEKFPADSPGHPYVEMATDFWNAYQSGGLMYDACAAAISYADAHQEILTPLGSDYHGAQSHTYIPADVCPFR